MPSPERIAVRRPGRRARAALGRSHGRASRRTSSRRSLFPLMLLAVNAGGLERRDAAARLPDDLLPRLRARRALHPGRAVRDDERRHGPRARHPDGLPEPPLADADAPAWRCSPASSEASSRWGSPGGRLPGGRARGRRGRRSRAARRRRAARASRCSSRSASARSARRRAADGLGRGRAGPLPAVLRLSFHLLDEHAAQPDRDRLVPDRRDLEPRLVPARGRAQPDHQRLGRRRRSRSASASRRRSRSSRSSLASRALQMRMARMMTLGASRAASPGGCSTTSSRTRRS